MNAYVSHQIWQLTDMERDSSVGEENPERYYGFYFSGLKENVDNAMKFPELEGVFREKFKGD